MFLLQFSLAWLEGLCWYGPQGGRRRAIPRREKRRTYAIEEDGVDVCAPRYDEEDRDDDEEVFVVVVHFCLCLHS